MEKNKETIYSVSQLNFLTRTTMEKNFPRIHVEGEISNFVCPSSGHYYFTLKDEKAQIRCAMFRGQNRRLRFTMEDGMQIVLKAKVSIYEGRGDYQLIVDSAQEAGDGKLQRAFEALKIKLSEKGLFDADRKKALPDFIETIGVATSSTGAAIRDILSVLKRRFPAMRVIIYPTLVQGNEAAADIVNAIQVANKRKECDALILARGGGSLEDLWPFNEEAVANAIFESKLPIVSGVGHETDVTIADFIADVRAPTPSAAAETVSPNLSECLRNTTSLFKLCIAAIHNALSQRSQELDWVTKRLRLQHPEQQLREQSQTLDQLDARMHRNINTTLEFSKQTLAHLAQSLHTLSPLATLSRGYAITYKGKNVVKSVADSKAGDTLTTRLSDGEITSTVI